MALPVVVPLVAGAVVGSLATYVYKDDEARRTLGGGAEWLGGTVKGGADWVGSVLTGAARWVGDTTGPAVAWVGGWLPSLGLAEAARPEVEGTPAATEQGGRAAVGRPPVKRAARRAAGPKAPRARARKAPAVASAEVQEATDSSTT
jgi:hypothetical protein